MTSGRLSPVVCGTLVCGVGAAVAFALAVVVGTENDTNYETCANRLSCSAVRQTDIALTPTN